MDLELFNIHLSKIIFSFILLGLIVFLRLNLVKIIRKFADKYHLFQSRTTLIVKYVNFTAFLIFLLGLLMIWGIDFKQMGIFMSSIFAVIGVAFFAQWSILSNITSGIVMFFTFPYKVGDFIRIHEGDHSIYGYIEEIKSFHVVVNTLQNELVTYPNSLMLQKGVSILKEEHIQKLIEEKAKKEEEKTEEKEEKTK